MEDLNERIIPVFTEIATQKEVISKLQEKVSKVKEERDGLRTRVHASQPLVKEVKDLKRQLIESERIADDAFQCAETAKDKAVALDLELRDYKTRVSDLAKNKRHVEDQLERHVAAVGFSPRFLIFLFLKGRLDTFGKGKKKGDENTNCQANSETWNETEGRDRLWVRRGQRFPLAIHNHRLQSV